MKQTRAMSLVEATTNIAVGLGVSVTANALVLPLFGFSPSLAENVGISVIYTGISLVRSYTLRRIFEFIRVRKETT